MKEELDEDEHVEEASGDSNSFASVSSCSSEEDGASDKEVDEVDNVCVGKTSSLDASICLSLKINELDLLGGP